MKKSLVIFLLLLAGCASMETNTGNSRQQKNYTATKNKVNPTLAKSIYQKEFNKFYNIAAKKINNGNYSSKSMSSSFASLRKNIKAEGEKQGFAMEAYLTNKQNNKNAIAIVKKKLGNDYIRTPGWHYKEKEYIHELLAYGYTIVPGNCEGNEKNPYYTKKFTICTAVTVQEAGFWGKDFLPKLEDKIICKPYEVRINFVSADRNLRAAELNARKFYMSAATISYNNAKKTVKNKAELNKVLAIVNGSQGSLYP